MRRVAATLASTAIALTATVIGVGQPAAAAGTVTSFVTIPGYGGVPLAARVDAPDEGGPHPLIVIPGAWGQGPAAGLTFAGLGFTVVSYAQRGFGGSGGATDLAGPATQRDFVAVLNWALTHTDADPARVAAYGVSYGAGTALLGAAADRRVRAVVAIGSWSYLHTSLAPGGTLSQQVLDSLLTDRKVTAEIAQLRTAVGVQPVFAVSLLQQLSPVRSPQSALGALNARNVPVLIGGSMEDSIVPASGLVSLFRGLAGPKRLLLVQGDHAAIASASSFSANGPAWGAVYWLLRYAKGDDLPASYFAPTVGVIDQHTGAQARSGSWPTGAGVTLHLRVGGGATTTSSPAWTRAITGGAPTTAESPPPDYTSTAPYVAPTVPMGSISSSYAVKWSAPTVTSATRFCGSPSVRFGLAASRPTVSLFSYLYSVTPGGTGTLLSATARTVTNLDTSASTRVSVALEPVCTTIPAGSHLALVIDTKDARYASRTQAGTRLRFVSTTQFPATLRI